MSIHHIIIHTIAKRSEYVRSSPLLPHNHTEMYVPSPECSHPWTVSKNTEGEIVCGETYIHNDEIIPMDAEQEY